MLRALAAELSDPGRFTRAKSYARDGAVFDIEIEPGEVRGQVQGSRYEPYLATLFAAPADDTDSLLGLIPDRDELIATCTCPDEGPHGFCKHALATLLVLADEITVDPGELTLWRSGDREELGARFITAEAGEVVDILAPWLTAPAPLPELPVVPARLPVPTPGSNQVTAALNDALTVLRAR
jgi:uncharacterized Zn finger protein